MSDFMDDRGIEWRYINEFPLYMVSWLGEIQRADKLGEEIRKPSVNHQGFPIITLFSGSGRTPYLRQINKLVAQEFVTRPEYDRRIYWDEPNSVWHIDGDLLNCRADNLRWEERRKVLEWNKMHRLGEPQFKCPEVKDNRTGIVYPNAFACALDVGMLESEVVKSIERRDRTVFGEDQPFRYVTYNHPA